MIIIIIMRFECKIGTVWEGGRRICRGKKGD
jgi:hypothetical protein